MASDGSHGPKPWKQREARTVFLRVPAADWVAVSQGKKREFRAASGQVSGLHFVEPPTLVVAYAIREHRHDSQAMVLEKRWKEPLGAISEESLRAEGFASFPEFRRYWMRRERRRFRPTRDVIVYRVRPITEEDRYDFADRLLKHLYGEWL
jgi:hypothetical protein